MGARGPADPRCRRPQAGDAVTAPLSPAARGVLLAVRAALRAGRVDLADQADGSTLATSTAPDGAVLLRAVLRLPVRGAADPRQLALPAVSSVPEPVRARWPYPLTEGDRIEYDGWQCTVREVDRDGPILLASDGEELVPLWREIEEVSPGVWRDRPLSGSAEERAEARAPKPKAAPKAKPARLTPEPEADALAASGQRCVVAVIHAGGPWELVWSDKMPGQMTYADAWKAVCEQAAKARRYNRGGRCVADLADEVKA